MALIVEDGTNVLNANSYIDDSYIESFLNSRGLLSETLDTTDKRESKALRAMDSLNVLNYCGSRVFDDQSLPFPRKNITLSDNRKLDSDVIPKELKQAQCWLIYYIDAGNDPASIKQQNIKREKVDVIEVEYQDGIQFNSVNVNSLPNVKNMLKYLTCNNVYLDRA